MKTIIGKYKESNEKVDIDLEELIDSRLLVQANSGGGKSYLLRKLLEATHDKVQHIVLDLEGEFSTLREKYDYLLVGKEGDIKINLKSAELLSHKILELGVSTIIDLYELKKHERILFVKRFLDAMIDSPKRLWHPVLVVVDEAHIFSPESSKAESASSVIDLCTRGRKRGFCAVLATQRLSKLSKDAAAECNNKLLGRTGLDVDRKRVSEELGFTTKQQNLSLRNLRPGEFYAFGPAISEKVEIMKVGEVETTHPKRGERIIKATTAPTEKIKSMLKKLTDLPKEAEKELKTKQDMKEEIRRLKLDLRKKQFNTDPKQLEREYQRGLRDSQVNLKQVEREVAKKENFYKNILNSLTNELLHFVDRSKKLLNVEIPSIDIKLKSNPNPVLQSVVGAAVMREAKASVELDKDQTHTFDEGNSSEIRLSPAYMRLLKACAMFNPNPITKAKMSFLANVPKKASTFRNGLSTLKTRGLIIKQGEEFIITDEGLEVAGDVDELPSDPDSLIAMWKKRLSPAYQRMFMTVVEAYPYHITKEDISERSNVPLEASTFRNGLSKIKTLGLIEVSSQGIKVSGELMEK